MGEAPTHPELLDWLAVEFMNRGWSIKQMHRLIMTSDAYQMASAVRGRRRIATRIRRTNTCGASACSDSTRRSCATASWRRAAASNLTIGGPPVFPHAAGRAAASMRTTASGRREADGPTSGGAASTSIASAAWPFPMFEVFDLPDQNVSLRRAQRVDGADAGADAAQQRVRAAAGEAVRGSRARRQRRTIRRSRSIWRTGSR